MGNKKRTGDIILVALHFDSPGLPYYAIAIKSAHFMIVMFPAIAFTISGKSILDGCFGIFSYRNIYCNHFLNLSFSIEAIANSKRYNFT